MPLSAARPSPAIVVMGVSGCGKTSVGQDLSAYYHLDFIEGDSLHPAENVAKMAQGTPLTDEDRWPWLDIIGGRLKQARAAHQGIVISCSALKRVYRDHLRNAAGGDLIFLHLKGSHAILAARMQARKGHFMPASLLESQLKTLEDPEGEPQTITVSIDGDKTETSDAAIAALAPFLKEIAR